MFCCRRLHRHLLSLVYCALLGLWLNPQAARAQTFDASDLHQPKDLDMTWLIKAGDDPAYARANFDDSQWTRVDPNLSLKQYFPAQHPEVIWYRLHVKVDPNQTGLALEEYNLSGAFEIYVNGEKLLANGQVSPHRPYTYAARVFKRIPDAAIATGSIVIAMRLYLSRSEWISTFPGFYPYNLVIGQEAAISDYVWLTTIGDNLLQWFYDFGGMGLGIIALALFTAQPQQREYLCIFLLFLCTALHAPLQFYLLFHNLPPWSNYANACFQIAELVLEALMFLAFLRMRVERWLRVWLALGAVGLLFGAWQTASGNGSAVGTLLSVTPELSLVAGLIPILLVVRWLRGNGEAGILLIPAVVAGLSVYVQLGVFLVGLIPAFAGAAMRFVNAVFNWTVGPFTININSFDGCLFVLSLAVILVSRSARIARQQAQLETELEAARQVQQILLPEKIGDVAGFSIEAAYVPAQQVGGDFFQILPQPDGSLLVVVGDVAGKGLPAAMLVSVLVGAIRGIAEFTPEPADLLANLNERLIGRVKDEFATTLAARIGPDGAVRLANAGHLPPYLDGNEVPVDGALPLGLKSGVRYNTIRFALPAGSRLTFYSDGIIEARNHKGELFGFDRGGAISTKPVAAIIDAAKKFGQQDDMTVIAVTREPAAVLGPYKAERLELEVPALAG
jgi:phosphoserine phosphatase RsbU/P